MGNLRLLLDGSTGAVQWGGAWGAWGTCNYYSAPATPFGYKGQTGAYTDAESGLVLMGARYYAPCVGRFLSRDPSSFSSGANLYGFCLNDPVNFFDPNGCFPISNDAIWRAIGRAANTEKEANGPVMLGIPTALMGAHDAVGRWGTAAGSTKVSAADTWKAAGGAGVQFASATMACAGPALGAVRSLGAAEEAVAACESGACFVAGTLVWVAESDKAGQWRFVARAIEQVKQGDYVAAKNETTGKVEVKRVLRTTVKHTAVTVSVTLAEAKSGQAAEVITSSREHPFFVEGKGFVPAGGLAIGNAIVTRAGPALVVKAVAWNRRVEGYDVFNFEVEDDHTYFVGNAFGGAWVHNPPAWCGSYRTQPYDVGSYKNLKTASDVGDGLQLHHLPQYERASNLGISGYTYGGGSVIALPDAEHALITAEQNSNALARSQMTAGQLLRDDMRMLRRYTNAPASALRGIYRMGKMGGF